MAFAAVQSLMELLERIMDADSIWVLDNEEQIELLQEKVSFLRDFLEDFSMATGEEVEDLEIKIRDIAYEAEDIIESYLCDLLHAKSDETRDQTLCQDLEKAIEETCCIHDEVMEIRRRRFDPKYMQQTDCLSVDRSRLTFTGKNMTMVGLDGELMTIMDWLTSSSSKLEVMSIVGMGGIGKTTLARNVFDDPLIVYQFDIRSWVTVSQEYQVSEILARLLGRSTSEQSQESEGKLAQRLYKSLKGIRYLIVMDDLWETKAWDDVRRLFPDDNNGSRVILTTRLADVGVYATSDDHVLNLSFLSPSESWSLLCKKVFGEESCPDYLVGVGQEIATYCRGLPLSLVVVGGLLSMEQTVGYWETVADSINSLLATDGGQCSEILSLSYNHLPARFKPCFLYFAVFPEDYDIPRSKLIKFWVAEGFLKPENSNSLEDTAERCLEELVNRSLIMISRPGYVRKVKTYRIHDLLREFCVTKVQNEKFLHLANRHHVPAHHEGIRSERRVAVHPNFPLQVYDYKPIGPAILRSFLCFAILSSVNLTGYRMLRLLDFSRTRLHDFPKVVVTLVHLRYLSLRCKQVSVSPMISLIWGLQTLIIDTYGYNIESLYHLPHGIWKLPSLRYVRIGRCHLPDPPCSSALMNLHTLKIIPNFRFTDEIIEKLPKLKKLEVYYDKGFKDWPQYHLSNIVSLHGLEALQITSCSEIDFPDNFRFPSSLKKLNLSGCLLPWEDFSTMVGSIPCLEALILRNDACEGNVWEPNEGEFCELKLLRLCSLDFVHWRADDSHFPKLKCLKISWCNGLEEIPTEIGNIATLEMIELERVRSSARTSAENILEEQRNSGNDALQVHFKNIW
ncbi:putative late blight resistance protein homolog R1B-14 [Henckelia pumila]|uniref:putative late blight resistance protein homolog R1B-14 n=1 Tax=Henckelia pumila TaxID=405737 RepID=UPI003C6E8EFE